MGKTNYISSIFFLLIAIFLSSCHQDIKYNIYKEYKPGSVLDLKALKRSERIIKSQGYILLVINNSLDEYYDPHILFYDSKRRLCCATYLPGTINYIKENVISFYLNSERDTRKKLYVNDLPPTFKMKPDLTKPSFDSVVINKVIYRLSFNNSSNKINCSVKVFDKFLEYDVLSNKAIDDEDYKIDSLIIDVGDLKIESIDHGRVLISRTLVDKNKYLIDSYVLNDSLANTFYTQIAKSYLDGLD